MLSLLTALILSSPSHALESVKQPFTLDCSGSAGTVHFMQTEEGLYYAIDVAPNHFAGYVHAYLEQGTKWEQGSANLIDPTYDPGKLWLSVSAIHGVKIWNAPHAGCMLTRNNEAPCTPIQVPGSFSKISTEWLNLMVNLTNKDHPEFMSLDLDNTHASLGEGASCSVTGL